MEDIIEVLGGDVRLRQSEGGFRTSIDAVLLAAACPAKPLEHILDLGCGLGSASFCLLNRVQASTLKGIDILPEAIALAEENAELNRMSDRAKFECIDIRDFEALEFHHVICNPPYLDAGEHVRSPDEARATAMGFLDEDIDLADWVNCAHRCIKGQGSLTLIHRADQIDDIIITLGKRFGAIEIIPLWPRHNREAKRVIVRAYKHRKSPAHIHPGLVLHKSEGGYTNEAEDILRKGKPIV